MRCFLFSAQAWLMAERRQAAKSMAAEASLDGFLQGKRRSVVFLTSLREEGFAGAILQNPAIYRDAEAEGQVLSFVRSLGLGQGNPALEAADEPAALEALFKACRAGFLTAADPVLDAFGLLRLRGGLGMVCQLDGSAHPARLKKEALSYAAVPALYEEVSRVLQSPPSLAHPGHPVHYLLEMNARQGHRAAIETLLNSLYRQRRIQRGRYLRLRLNRAGKMEGEILEAARASRGSALVLDFVPDCAEDCEPDCLNLDHLAAALDAVGRHARQVLFILCLPQLQPLTREMMDDLLPGFPFLLLGQQRLAGEQARGYLEGLALGGGAQPDEALFRDALREKDGLFEAELRDVYEAWYSAYLRRAVYPQYRDLVMPGLAVETPDAAEDAACEPGSGYATLQAMIGLSGAKTTMDQLLQAHHASKLYARHGLQGGAVPLHMVFTGNPGTAKTTVARLYARILREEGILKKGALHEVSRADLVGKYVGWTARLVREHIKKAKGSVLFIDEAYSLFDGRDGLFGEEAVNTLVMEMENCREDTVIILAGYPERMEGLLNNNPGLRSRIGFHIRFEDYTAAEMLAILRFMAEGQGFQLDAGVAESLLPWLEQAGRVREAGNGRFVRNLLDKARMKQAGRLLGTPAGQLTEAQVRTLLLQDFDEPLVDLKAQARIGFR